MNKLIKIIGFTLIKFIALILGIVLGGLFVSLLGKFGVNFPDKYGLTYMLIFYSALCIFVGYAEGKYYEGSGKRLLLVTCFIPAFAFSFSFSYFPNLDHRSYWPLFPYFLFSFFFGSLAASYVGSRMSRPRNIPQ